MYITEENLLRKNNNFDALRLIAAIFVFISHTYVIRGMGGDELIAKLTGYRYFFSVLGLAIFFSMSGFLICHSLLFSASIKQYLINRFLRIWPAYAICILFCILIGIYFTSLPVFQFISHPQTFIFFFKNISLLSSSFPLPGVFDNKAINPSIWTIPVEVRLYLLLLITYLVTKLRFRQVLLLLLITVWLAKLLIPFEWKHAIFKSHILTAIDLSIYFLAGACFYLYKDKVPLKLYIWLILFVCWLSLHIWFKKYLAAAELPFFVYSIMWMVFRWNKIPFLKADISYGVYLFAGPIQKVIHYTIGKQISFSTYFLLTGLCTLVVAILSWHFIEKKALSLKHAFKNKPMVTSL